MARIRASSRGQGSQYSFSRAPTVGVPRSVYKRDHTITQTQDEGWLVPCFVDEVMPGDSVSLNMVSFVRMATPQYPVMSNLYFDTFFFFVPYRLVWSNFVKMMGERDNPADHINYSVPQFQASTSLQGSLSDYLGIPIGISMDFNSLFHRAYNLIFREWFRDQDVVNAPVVDLDNGPDNLADYVLRRRMKRHDYFTGCRPWVQKGDPVELEIASIEGDGSAPTFDVGATTNLTLETATSPADHLALRGSPTMDTDAVWNDPHLQGIVATINEIREAFQIQRLLERDARSGSRYIEVIKSHFQVDSLDMRHQRPEYLGGGSHRINSNPVASTAATVDPVGTVNAYAVGAGAAGFNKSFTEHGILMGLSNVRGDLIYQQGLDKMFSRQTRYDFYWPALQALGEQAVLNKEIDCSHGTPDGVFGYQERWAEYRHKQSGVRGAMRSAAATPLDAWHLALDFGTPPALNQTFMEEQPPVSRVLRAPSDPHFLCDYGYVYRHARPMPTYSVPGMIDHF